MQPDGHQSVYNAPDDCYHGARGQAMGSSERRALLLVLGLALTVRLLFALPAMRQPQRSFIPGDSEQYHRLAINLAHDGRYSTEPAPPFKPHCFRVPVYPAFIGSLYAVFGSKPAVVVIAQVFIGVATAFILYRLTTLLFGLRVGVLAALFLALDPLSAAHSAFLMSEVLFTFLLTLALYTFFRSLSSPVAAWGMVLSGILFGLSSLCRPTTLYYPLLLLPITALKFHSLRRSGLLLAGYVLTLLPWVVRNGVACGVRAVSTQQYDVVISFTIKALEDAYGWTTMEADRYLLYQTAKRKGNWEIEKQGSGEPSVKKVQWVNLLELTANEPEKGRQLADTAKSLWLSDIGGGTLVKTYLKGMVAVLTPYVTYSALAQLLPPRRTVKPPQGGLTAQILSLLSRGKIGEALRLAWQERIAKMPPLLTALWLLSALYGLLLYALMVFGLRRCAKEDRSLFWLMLLTLLYFLLVSAPLGLTALSRFRVPVQPLLCLLSALGWTGWRQHRANPSAETSPAPKAP